MPGPRVCSPKRVSNGWEDVVDGGALDRDDDVTMKWTCTWARPAAVCGTMDYISRCHHITRVQSRAKQPWTVISPYYFIEEHAASARGGQVVGKEVGRLEVRRVGRMPMFCTTPSHRLRKSDAISTPDCLSSPVPPPCSPVRQSIIWLSKMAVSGLEAWLQGRFACPNPMGFQDLQPSSGSRTPAPPNM